MKKNALQRPCFELAAKPTVMTHRPSETSLAQGVATTRWPRAAQIVGGKMGWGWPLGHHKTDLEDTQEPSVVQLTSNELAWDTLSRAVGSGAGRLARRQEIAAHGVDGVFPLIRDGILVVRGQLADRSYSPGGRLFAEAVPCGLASRAIVQAAVPLLPYRRNVGLLTTLPGSEVFSF